MKTFFLTSVLTFFSILSLFGQARLGSEFEEVKQEFADPKFNLESGVDEDGNLYLKVDLDRSGVVHFFNEDKVCFMSIIIPKGQGVLNAMVQMYNDQFVVISSTEWKMYSGNGIASIELVFTENEIPYFIWKPVR